MQDQQEIPVYIDVYTILEIDLPFKIILLVLPKPSW